MDSRARMSIDLQLSEYRHNARFSTFVVSIHDILICVAKCKFIRYRGLLPKPVVGPIRFLGSKNFEKLLL